MSPEAFGSELRGHLKVLRESLGGVWSYPVQSVRAIPVF